MGGPKSPSSIVALGMAAAAAEQMLDIVGSGPATGDSIGDQLDQLPIEDALVEEGVSELRQVFELMEFQGVDKSIYALDLSIARGLDYYTGTVYETLLNDHPGLGSVCSGGRYDDLASLYTSARLPGVGISIGLTRLFAQLRQIGVIQGSESTVAVLVTLLDDAGLGPESRTGHSTPAGGDQHGGGPGNGSPGKPAEVCRSQRDPPGGYPR